MTCPITPKVPVNPSMVDLYRYMLTGKIKFNLDPDVQKDGHFAFDVVGDLQDKTEPGLYIALVGENKEKFDEHILSNYGITAIIDRWGGSVSSLKTKGAYDVVFKIGNLPEMMGGDDSPLDGTEFDGMLELSGKIFNVLMDLFNGEIDVFFQYDEGPEKKVLSLVLCKDATSPGEVVLNTIMTVWTAILQSYGEAGSEWFDGPVDLNKLIISIRPMDLG